MADRLWRSILVAIPMAIALTALLFPPVDDALLDVPELVLPSAFPATRRPTVPRPAFVTARRSDERALDRVMVTSRDRDAATTPVTAVAYVSPLEEMLGQAAAPSNDPVRRYTALGYLGLLGKEAHRAGLLEAANAQVSPGDALPAIENLIIGFADRSRFGVVRQLADDERTDGFHAIWALELLAYAGDRSRVRRVRAIARSRRNPVSRRLRALELLADMGDDSLRADARAMGHDPLVPYAIRMHGLACVVRMDAARRSGQKLGADASAAARTIRAALTGSGLSLSERLTLTHHLVVARDESVVPFLYRVVEQEGRTVLDQIRALNMLALLGRKTHVRALRKAARHRPRARHAAARVLALMGDRSQTAQLVDDCHRGDLGAARALVLTRLLDQRRVVPSRLLQTPRFRSLLDS